MLRGRFFVFYLTVLTINFLIKSFISDFFSYISDSCVFISDFYSFISEIMRYISDLIFTKEMFSENKPSIYWFPKNLIYQKLIIFWLYELNVQVQTSETAYS